MKKEYQNPAMLRLESEQTDVICISGILTEPGENEIPGDDMLGED